MSDGAHQGINANDALKIILSGDDKSSKKHMTDEEFNKWIRSAPDNVDSSVTGDDIYGETCRSMAKYFLNILETQEVNADADLYDIACKVFPEFHENFEGISGFMYGWSVNAARKCKGLDPVPNPAIMDI